MTRTRIAVLLLAALAFIAGARFRTIPAHAQSSTTPLAITVAGVHTSCLPPATGSTTFCFASDGLWQSLNGAAYVQLGASTSAGVTSWNGLTGIVTYTPPAAPVSSVNGKTGAVVIAATTTATTTLQ